MAKLRTHYDNLKVTKDAPISVIKSAYKTLCQNYHPDKFSDGNGQALQMMKLINKAYEVLSDPGKRAEYDKWLGILEKESPAASSGKDRAEQQYADNHLNTGMSWRNAYSYSIHTKNPVGMYLSHNRLERKYRLWLA